MQLSSFLQILGFTGTPEMFAQADRALTFREEPVAAAPVVVNNTTTSRLKLAQGQQTMDQRILELHARGMNNVDIALQVRCTDSYVSRVVTDAGLRSNRMPRRIVTDELVARVRALWPQTKGTSEDELRLAKELGTSPTTISNIVRGRHPLARSAAS